MAVPLRQAPSAYGITDRTLALMPLPTLLSERQSSDTATIPANPRTFEQIEAWVDFDKDALQIADILDDTRIANGNLWTVLEDVLDPAITVQGAMEDFLFPQVNKLATRLGLQFKLVGGGSGRSLSCTDMVLLDRGAAQDLKNLSARVYGNGEAKKPWQWCLKAISFEEELKTTAKRCAASIEVLQQLFGDMVMDEAGYGWLTNFNQTVFVRRKRGNSKILQVSPIVRIDEAPVVKFLYFLREVEFNRDVKISLSRVLVTETPPQGYTMAQEARRQKRGQDERDGDEPFASLHVRPLHQIGVSGSVVGLGKFGNVLEGKIDSRHVAIKCFDLRKETAATSFVAEQQAYESMKSLQGKFVPRVVTSGRLPHCNVYYLALTYEGSKSLATGASKEISDLVWNALSQIHGQGVVHGDLRPAHILLSQNDRVVKFIDFGNSKVDATREEQLLEVEEMNRLLAEV